MDPTTARARALRQSLTPPEARLWVALKRLRAKGYHFRKQSPFRGYILDFVCNRFRLVIEVDGLSHEHRVEHDQIRDAVLAREGFRTLRFTNASVRDHLEDVMDRIVLELASHGPTRPSRRDGVPPHEGEGE